MFEDNNNDFFAGIDTESTYEVLPNGIYEGHITGLAVKESKANAANRYLKMEITLENRRKVFDNLNYINSNLDKHGKPAAQNIARKSIAIILKYAGIDGSCFGIGKEDALLGLKVKVDLKTETYEGKQSNKVNKYLDK